MDERRNPLRAPGIFLACAFAAGAAVYLIGEAAAAGWKSVPTTGPSVLIAIAALFLLSSRFDRLAVLQPLSLLALTPLPLMKSHESMYGLGFFVAAVVLLHRGGYLDRNRIPKLVALVGYLYAVEIVTTIARSGWMLRAFSPVFFITTFLAFLYLAFKDSLASYLRGARPPLSLAEKGLSEAEAAYVKAVYGGRTSKEIAADAGIAESTVRNTLARAYKKLGVADKLGLVTLFGRSEVGD